MSLSLTMGHDCTEEMAWQYDHHLGPLLPADQGQPCPEGVAHEAQQRPGHQLPPGAQVEEMPVLPLTMRMFDLYRYIDRRLGK